MDYTRSFNRFELKYVMPYDDASAFVGKISQHLEQDPHGGSEGLYRISSLYYDSDGLACFWEKMEGLKIRRKLRVRRYDDAADDHALVEIKQRTDRTVQKRRVPLPLTEVFSILPAPGQPDPATSQPADDPVLSEALYLVTAYGMRPKIVIRYQRRAFQARYDPGLRITIDTHLQCRTHNLDWSTPEDDGTYFLPPDISVLEIKFNNSVPLWLTGHVAHFECQLRRLSKYCEGVNQIMFNGSVL